jgi:ribosome recycling factor
MVTPFDKSGIKDIEKAIRTCDLGLNPATAGVVIRVPLPPLTEERRRDLVKIVRALGEEARVSIRNIRRDANADIQELKKAKEISEDDERKAGENTQKTTDRFIAEVEKLLTTKETELLQV